MMCLQQSKEKLKHDEINKQFHLVLFYAAIKFLMRDFDKTAFFDFIFYFAIILSDVFKGDSHVKGSLR